MYRYSLGLLIDIKERNKSGFKPARNLFSYVKYASIDYALTLSIDYSTMSIGSS